MTWSIDEIARRIAQDLPTGAVVNLGVGLPLAVGNHITDPSLVLHSENGLFGMGGAAAPGHEDPDVVNAGKQSVTLVRGAAITDQADSFGAVRSGVLDLAILGAYQVAVNGDLANWRRPDEKIAGIGGALDIAMGAKSVWAMMKARTDDGSRKLLTECTFPLTASGVVRRVYCELGILEPRPDQGVFVLLELAPEVTEDDIRAQIAGEVMIP